MESNKDRKANFTDEECLLLIEEYRARSHIIRAQLGANVTSRQRKAAWQEIADAINARNASVHRSVKNIRKKWNNLSSEMKEHNFAERNDIQKTGRWLVIIINMLGLAYSARWFMLLLNIGHAYWMTYDCSAIIFVKHVKIIFFQVLSVSSIKLHRRKPRFDSKFLKTEKRYDRTDFSTW